MSRRNRNRRPVAPRTPTRATARPSAAKASRSAVKPLRSLATLAVVGGLIATVALPAYGAWRPAEDAVTIQQVAADDAQSLVVASNATGVELARGGYAATTEDEIAKKKAQEAAAARARAIQSSVASVPINISMVSPGSGAVRWPLLNFTKGRGLGDSGYHQGVDLLTSCGTPIYAAAAGVVRVSQESFGGYGVAITIDHVINGQKASTLYGHMTYGSRQVAAGQAVEAGQLIGLVGSTGSSTACHLHFEVRINDALVDPWAWLQANAG
nr:M23 family metallopeptidase [Microbacterium immunditiarum]